MIRMKPAGHWILNGMAVMSLIVCVAAIALPAVFRFFIRWRFDFTAIFALLGTLPWLIAHWPRRKKPRDGYCIQCGYDLRATPERCPECGTVVTK